MRGAIVAAICAVMIGAPFLWSGGLWAKLPAPTEAEKAAAASKAAAKAAAAKHQTELLHKAQDMTAERYKKSQAMKAKAGPAMATPAAAKK